MEATTATHRGNGSGDSEAVRLETIGVTNPATGDEVGQIAVDGADQVHAAVERARSAQRDWEAMGFDGRRAWLDAWRDWMLRNSEELADLFQAETGKVRSEAGMEVPLTADLINFYGKNAPRFLADEEVKPHLPILKTKRLKVVYRPHPVVGIIAPWNFPILLSLGDAVPALAAGAAAVLKPSELTPLTVDRMIQGWRELGAPDVLHAVHGRGETGEHLVDEVDFIQFTGSDVVGRKVMKRAADRLTPVSLELGGKDPMIVCGDANVDRAAKGATFGGLANSGQVCLSIERVYVEEPIYDEFVSKLKSEIETLEQGLDGREYGKEIGAMINPEQTGKVEAQVNAAVEQGAHVLTGGRRREGEGDYYEPTLVVDVDHSMEIMRDETFGPVISVMKVKDTEEAIRLANDSRYGLAASVFTSDRERGEQIARRLEVGSCNINDVLINYAVFDVPMGGWKTSGLGYRNGVGGIRKFCRLESLVDTRFPQQDSELLWFPYEGRKRRALARMTRAVMARGLRNRLGLGRD